MYISAVHKLFLLIYYITSGFCYNIQISLCPLRTLSTFYEVAPGMGVYDNCIWEINKNI
jgi:hypothetical protein